VRAQLLLVSPRSGPLLALLPVERSTEVQDALRALDLHAPYVPRAAAAPVLSLPADWNVVLVVVDSLRADAVPPTLDERPEKRFARSDAPFLSELAQRSFRFHRVYAGATYTYLAMPAMFRSELAFTKGRRGAPLGVLAAEQGRTPIAVVNDFFAQPLDDEMAELLGGFVDVRTYNERAQDEQRKLTHAALAQAAARPFFAWLHYYGVHSPGWDGKAIPRDVQAWPENYKRGLRWVDGELRWLFQELEGLGIAERTAVVITADHGEGLMDTGHMFHGPFVYEETVRVPLLIYLPGRAGRYIDATVGSVDIVPTLLELMGGKPRFAHRGRSLAPLLVSAQARWDEPYFFLSGNEQQAGAVRGADKHIFDRKTHAHMRFALARDPLEDHNLFDPRQPADRALLDALVQQAPQLFPDDLHGREVASLLDATLARLPVEKPPAALPFLLRLIAELPDPNRLAWARGVFASAQSDEVRLQVIAALYALDAPGFGKLLKRRLRELAGSDADAAFVDALADLGVGAFERDYVAKRFLAAAAQDGAAYLPWLRLTAGWPSERKAELAPLLALGKRFADPAAQPDELRLRIFLRALAGARLRALRRDGLADALVRWLDHPSLGVQADAARALGRTSVPQAEALLRSRLRGQPLVVRLGALEGLTALLGERAVPALRELAREDEAAATAVRLASGLHSPAAQALLADLARHAHSRFVRANAGRALAAARDRPKPLSKSQ
jgi:arylsulfatase A-like enzyme